MLGVVGFAAAIPAFLISPWAGVVVDRVPKRSLLIVTQTISMLLAFVMSALAFTGVVQVWQVVLLAAIMGAVNAFDGPGRQAFVVEMVGHDDLPNAIALNSMTFNAARVIGPAFGGVLLATVGAAWCFFLNGFSFMAVIVSLFMMRIVHQHVLHENTIAMGADEEWLRLHRAPTRPARVDLAGALLQFLWHLLYDSDAGLCRSQFARRRSRLWHVDRSLGRRRGDGRLCGGQVWRPRPAWTLAVCVCDDLPVRVDGLCLHAELADRPGAGATSWASALCSSSR